MTGVMSPDRGAILSLQGLTWDLTVSAQIFLTHRKMFLFLYVPRKANDSEGFTMSISLAITSKIGFHVCYDFWASSFPKHMSHGVTYTLWKCAYEWVLERWLGLSRGPEFNSQQPPGGSQPSIMRIGAVFWCV